MANWKDLSLKDKAEYIRGAVRNGIYNLDDIRKDYETNSYSIESTSDSTSLFNDGGPIYIKPENRGKFNELLTRTGKSASWFKEHGTPLQKKRATFALNARKWKHDDGGDLYKNGGLKKLVKDMAYNISTNEDVFRKGNASVYDIIKSIFTKKEDTFEDDNRRAYIYGTGDRYPEIKEPIKGFDYSNYFKKTGYKNVKDVYGTINPYGEYHIDPEYETLLRELAKHNYHFYDNADNMFIESDSEELGYRDDVANFIHQVGIDSDNNVVMHDSDVYDFYPKDYNYSRSSTPLKTKIQAKLMEMVGQPYTIRQENQPVIFDGNMGLWSYGITNHLNDMTEQDIAKATNTGLISPAIVTPNYANGGKTQKAHLWGEFDYPETIKPSNNKFERISNDRYNTAYNALRQSGYHGVDADRLAKILASQSITETGWVDKNDTHNYAGYLDNKRKLIKYNSPEDFWKTHISNLSNRWPEWDTANDTNEYFNIINHVDLGLTTKDKFNKYNKKHRNNPVYLYAPDWENTNYLGRMNSVSKRVNKNVPQKIGPVYD